MEARQRLHFHSPSQVHTVDGRNPFRTTQEALVSDDSPASTNKQWFPMVSKSRTGICTSTVSPKASSAPLALRTCPGQWQKSLKLRGAQ